MTQIAHSHLSLYVLMFNRHPAACKCVLRLFQTSGHTMKGNTLAYLFHFPLKTASLGSAQYGWV